MATTTPNFGWPVPTSTDLVKDGATAMEALGDAIDTSMVDLKGGTTGQVLSKASSADMDFTWVAQDDSNAIQNTIVDAKGDLIAASAADTPARLAVGNNGETLVADSSTSTGLRYQQQNIKNYAYNSNFDIWQRGTSIVNPSGYYADRWSAIGVINAITVSRQTSNPPVGSYYYMRHTATGAAAYVSLVQMLETQDVEELWGKTVTLSVKLRRNSTVNNTGLAIGLEKSATVDAGTGATWTSISNTSVGIASIPTGSTSSDWYTASVTTTIPSDGTANSIRINIGYNGGTASGSVYEFSQVMLQVGSVVTAYQRQNVTLQGELAACQRYYYRTSGTANYYIMAQGVSDATTSAKALFQLPVTLRTASTDITYGNLYWEEYQGTAGLNPTVTAVGASNNVARLSLTGMSGLTAGRVGYLFSNNSSTSYIAINAEL